MAYSKKDLERMMRSLGIDPEEVEKEAEKEAASEEENEVEDEEEDEEKEDDEDKDNNKINYNYDKLKKYISNVKNYNKKIKKEPEKDPLGLFKKYYNKKYTYEPDPKKDDIENILSQYGSKPIDPEILKQYTAHLSNMDKNEIGKLANSLTNAYKSLCKKKKKKTDEDK